MKLQTVGALSAALCLSVSAQAGIYDFGTYTPEDEGYIPEDMLEFPDTPEAYVSGLWLSKDFLGHEVKFVVQLAEGLPFVGAVNSDPVPVKILKTDPSGTVLIELRDGTGQRILLKETDQDGSRTLLVKPGNALHAFKFTGSTEEYLTPRQVVQSAEDLRP